MTFTDDELILEYKKKRNECTSALDQYRDKLKTANGILEDMPKIKEVIKIEQQMKRDLENDSKVRKKNYIKVNTKITKKGNIIFTNLGNEILMSCC